MVIMKINSFIDMSKTRHTRTFTEANGFVSFLFGDFWHDRGMFFCKRTDNKIYTYTITNCLNIGKWIKWTGHENFKIHK